MPNTLAMLLPTPVPNYHPAPQTTELNMQDTMARVMPPKVVEKPM